MEAREAGRGPGDGPQHFGREARPAHAEQDDVARARAPDGVGERTQPAGVRPHRVDRLQPSEPRGNRRLRGGVARPHLGAARPERVDELVLCQTSAGVVERAIERARIDREGHRTTMRLTVMVTGSYFP